MPAIVVESASTQCTHGGAGQPTARSPKVKISGKKIIVKSATYSISGCAYPVLVGGPCVTAQGWQGAGKVKSGGVAVILEDKTANCIPTGAKLSVADSGQTKVKAK